MESQVSQAQIDYAYQVLTALTEAIDRTAADPKLLQQLKAEALQKAPEIFDALMCITPPEHRPIIYELFKSLLNLAKTIYAKKEE